MSLIVAACRWSRSTGEPPAKAKQYAERGAAELHYARKMFEARALRLGTAQNIVAMLGDIRTWGEIGMIPALNARRHPNRVAVIDDEGEFTFGDLDAAAHAVAHELLTMGVRGGDGVGILARNHRWFLVALLRRGPGRCADHPAQLASSRGRRSKRSPSARAPR